MGLKRSLLDQFEQPLPRNPLARDDDHRMTFEEAIHWHPFDSIAFPECVFADGPLKGKKLGDCTRSDLEKAKSFFRDRKLERGRQEADVKYLLQMEGRGFGLRSNIVRISNTQNDDPDDAA